MSGTLGGTVVANVPGVTLTGTLHVEVDTAASRLEVAGLGVELTVLGQHLSGDLTVALSGSTVQVTLAGATLQLAGGLVSVTDAAADLTVTADGIHGTFSGTIAFAAAGISLTTAVDADIDTRPGTPHVRVTAAAAHLVVAGQELVADLSFERTAVTGGSVVTLTLTALTASIGGVATVTGGGTMVIAPDGVAGSLALSATFGPALTALGLGTTSVALDVNTRPTTVVVGAADPPRRAVRAACRSRRRSPSAAWAPWPAPSPSSARSRRAARHAPSSC